MSRAEAIALLADLERRGVEVVAEGEELRFRPAMAVPATTLARMRALKAELIGVLMRPTVAAATAAAPGGAVPPVSSCYACEGEEFVRVAGGPLWICRRCYGPSDPRRIVETFTLSQPRPRSAGGPA